MTPSGIEPATFRFLAQCLTQPTAPRALHVVSLTAIIYLKNILNCLLYRRPNAYNVFVTFRVEGLLQRVISIIWNLKVHRLVHNVSLS
jgi:hypothetical protein